MGVSVMMGLSSTATGVCDLQPADAITKDAIGREASSSGMGKSVRVCVPVEAQLG